MASVPVKHQSACLLGSEQHRLVLAAHVPLSRFLSVFSSGAAPSSQLAMQVLTLGCLICTGAGDSKRSSTTAWLGITTQPASNDSNQHYSLAMVDMR